MGLEVDEGMEVQGTENTDTSTSKEIDAIGKELDGNASLDTNNQDQEISPANQGLETASDLSQAREDIGIELNGENIKQEFRPDIKRNIDGNEISGPPQLRDISFSKLDAEGKPQLDANGNPEVDWEKYAEHTSNDLSGGADERFPINPNATLAPGQIIDRYGSERGHFASPKGASYESRSLPYDEKTVEYHQYQVVNPIKCTESTVAPNFGEPGGATQYEFEKSFRDMLEDGDIVEL